MRPIALVFAVGCCLSACTDTPAPLETSLQPSFGNGGAPVSYEMSFVIDYICADPLLIELSGKEKLIGHPNGSLVVTSPALRARLTNMTTGRSVVEGITGTLRVTFHDNGDATVDMTGRNLVEDEAGLFITAGSFSQIIDAAGNYVQPLQGKGRLVDVCELVS